MHGDADAICESPVVQHIDAEVERGDESPAAEGDLRFAEGVCGVGSCGELGGVGGERCEEELGEGY